MELETAAIACVTAVLTSLIAYWLGDRRMRREFMLDHQAETVARRLLNDSRWKFRSFDRIKHHLGGFSDDDLRRVLVRSGAIRFKSKDGQEIWSLMDRCNTLLDQIVADNFECTECPVSINSEQSPSAA